MQKRKLPDDEIKTSSFKLYEGVTSKVRNDKNDNQIQTETIMKQGILKN